MTAVKKKAAAQTQRRAKEKAKAASIGHPGIGAFVKGLLVSGKSTDQILRAVEKQFPGAETSRASVSWYRSRLNKGGHLK
jgi:hypothetical protein